MSYQMIMNSMKLCGLVYVKNFLLTIAEHDMNDSLKNNILMLENICLIFSDIEMLLFGLAFILYTSNLVNSCFENMAKTGHNMKWVVADFHYLHIILLELLRNSWANSQVHFLVITHFRFGCNDRKQDIFEMVYWTSISWFL